MAETKNSRFTQKDVGKKVALDVLVESLSEDCEIQDGFRIPIDAIRNFGYLITDPSSAKRINVISPEADKVSVIDIARRLGAQSMTFKGYVKEVGEDYIMISKYE